MQNKKVYRLATRNSQLAMVQTHEIIDKLLEIKELNLTKENFQIVEVSQASGDTNQKDPLFQMGGVGVFTKQVEVELLQNKADIAVHSLKDLPTVVDQRLVVAAIPELQQRNDSVLLNQKYKTFDDLLKQENPKIGSSSLRRISCLKHNHKHLIFENIRGNLNTRIKKLQNDEYDAIILAQAGLNWNENLYKLDEEKYLYAPSQGALGVQCRIDDQETINLLKHLDNAEARIRVEAERQFLNKLEGGCKLPIGVYSKIEDDQLFLIGQVWDLEGTLTIRDEIKLPIQDKEIGTKLAQQIAQKGGAEILKKIRLN